MKKLIFLSLFVLLSSCKSDDGLHSKEAESVCIEDPLEDIMWLQKLKTTFEMSTNIHGSQIIQYVYEGTCVYLVNSCYLCDDSLIVVYNEVQEIVCEFGGISGTNTCPNFEEQARNEMVLWDHTNP